MADMEEEVSGEQSRGLFWVLENYQGGWKPIWDLPEGTGTAERLAEAEWFWAHRIVDFPLSTAGSY